MGKIDEVEYWVPQHVRDYLHEMGFQLPLEAMEGHIRGWHEWMQATGSFYDYRDYVATYHMLRTGRSPCQDGYRLPRPQHNLCN